MSKLISFNSTPLSEALQISAKSLRVNSQTIELEFHLEGQLESILWPEFTPLPAARKNDLWKTTCFEAFFSTSSELSTPYFEINCSPRGDWNAYTFESYRQGMNLAQSIEVKLLKREIHSHQAHFVLQICGSLPESPLLTSLTSVIQFTDGTTSYWALEHEPGKADFHKKNTFTAKT